MNSTNSGRHLTIILYSNTLPRCSRSKKGAEEGEQRLFSDSVLPTKPQPTRVTGNVDCYRRSCPPLVVSGVIRKNNNTRYQLANRVCVKTRHHRTCQSFTSFIISCSRANAARSRRYASLSPSANSSGTRCMRDQIFSLCSSLENSRNQPSLPILDLHK